MKFSVIIPVYNREYEISRAVESVLKQNHASFEIIVVDDGSTDQTGSAVQSFGDLRIIYFRQENKERGAARNAGMNVASGEYITFLDSDDEFLPGHLEQMEKFIAANPGYGIYCSAYLKEGSRGIQRIALPADIPGSLPDGNFLSCNGVFISDAIAKQFQFVEDRAMAGLEDWEYWLRISLTKKMIGAPLYTSRMNFHDARSVLQTAPASIEKRFAAFFGYVKAHPEFVRIQASGESYMALHLAMTGKYKREARQHLKKARRLRPSIIFTRRYFAIIRHLL